MRRVDAGTIASAPLWMTARAKYDSIQSGAKTDDRDADYAETLERGYQEGHALGLADAQECARLQALEWQQTRRRELDDARKQYEQAGAKLVALASAIRGQLRAEAARAEAISLEIAYSAIVRMLGTGYADRSVMKALVLQAMRDIEVSVDRVMVSSEDALALEDVEGITVGVDPRLEAGQCRIESSLGCYDTGLDVRLDLLRQALLAGLTKHRTESDPT